MNQLAVALYLALFLSACGTAPTSDNSDRYRFSDLEEVDHISTFDIRHWQSIDEKSLIVGAGKKQQYLLILRTPVRDLQYAYRLGITSTGTTVDAYFDCVKTTPAPCSSSSQQARILRIYKLADEQQAAWVKAKILNTSKIP